MSKKPFKLPRRTTTVLDRYGHELTYEAGRSQEDARWICRRCGATATNRHHFEGLPCVG